MTAGCVKAGLKVVRIGRPEATRFDLEKYNLLEIVKVGVTGIPQRFNQIFFFG